jgi:hypothetical protein
MPPTQHPLKEESIVGSRGSANPTTNTGLEPKTHGTKVNKDRALREAAAGANHDFTATVAGVHHDPNASAAEDENSRSSSSCSAPFTSAEHTQAPFKPEEQAIETGVATVLASPTTTHQHIIPFRDPTRIEGSSGISDDWVVVLREQCFRDLVRGSYTDIVTRESREKGKYQFPSIVTDDEQPSFAGIVTAERAARASLSNGTPSGNSSSVQTLVDEVRARGNYRFPPPSIVK